MSGMEDGWKRLVRELQERAEGMGYISLEVQNEDLGTLAQNAWASPTTATLFGNLPPKNFSYDTGSIVYTGTKKARVFMNSIESVLVAGGNQAEAEITNGFNNTQCLSGIMPASSAFGGVIPLDTMCAFEIEPGDTLDAYTRQTSEVGGANVTIVKGVYHVWIYDILDDSL
jgi:hypothetical protein